MIPLFRLHISEKTIMSVFESDITDLLSVPPMKKLNLIWILTRCVFTLVEIYLTTRTCLLFHVYWELKHYVKLKLTLIPLFKPLFSFLFDFINLRRVKVRSLVPRQFHPANSVPPPILNHPVSLLYENLLRFYFLILFLGLLYILNFFSALRGKLQRSVLL